MPKILLSFVLFFSVLFAYSQHDQDRPKVGLVLSGGGAKGYAHVGVIKIIEEAGVKIDYIAGTSMGAVIGGMYAAGYNAKQLDSIFKLTDSEAIINDYPTKSSRISFNDQTEDKYAITLPIKDYKVSFPSSYSKGLYNYNFLMEKTMHVRHINDFSKLPIPFVCIAQDIETGEEVILNKGSLAKCMVASSAFPTLYSPVIIDGKRLVDGGVINNFPVEELRKMGADIVIGVNVQDGLKEKPDVNGGASIVVMQIANFDMARKMESKKKLVDILIEPDMSGFNFFSFKQGRGIIEKGEESARESLSELQKLSHVVGVQIKEPRIVPSDSIVINSINVNKLKYYSKDYVLGQLFFKPQSKIKPNQLFDGIINLNSAKNFERIDYSLDAEDNLNIHLTENKHNTLLRLGLHYDKVFKTGVLLNLTSKHLLLTNDILSMDIVLGDSYRWLVEYFIDNGYSWSFGARMKYIQFNHNLEYDFDQGQSFINLGLNTVNIDYDDWFAELYTQTVLFKTFSSSIGLESKYLRIQSNADRTTQGIYENDLMLNVFGRMKYNNLDEKYFPMKGWFFSGEYKAYLLSSRYFGGFEPFYIAKADMGVATSLSENVGLLLQGEGGFSVKNHKSPYLDFILGGFGYETFNNFRHFYGYQFFSLAGDSYVKASLTLDYEFTRKHHLNFIANYANIGDDIFPTNEWLTSPDYSGYALGYSYETFLGPIELKQIWSPESRHNYLWVSVGAQF